MTLIPKGLHFVFIYISLFLLLAFCYLPHCVGHVNVYGCLVPERVTSLQSPRATPNSIDLQWSQPTGEYASFRIEYSDEDNVAGNAVTVRRTDTDATLTSLDAGKRYDVNVYTVSNSVSSDPTSGSFRTCESKNMTI